ncbi:MAG: zinc ribbon domain-containing protein [Deltaproteobacteria bacterium]|nr:MAG: zinc ribbon domain-containing protein [Deltaproteobacteria bacterium]
MTRREEEGRYQMLWDCPACGAEKLLGLDHRFCPACGSPQDPELRYFPSDDDKVAVDDHPYHGADKVCPACDTPNSAASDFCEACGSPLDDAAAAKQRQRKVTAEGERFDGESGSDAKREARERKQAAKEARLREMQGVGPEPAGPPKKSFGNSKLGMACFSIIALALGIGMVFCCLSWLWSTTSDVTVQGHEWERTIQVEAYGPTTKRAWRNEVPAGARDLRCTQEKRSTKRVKDGEECKTVREDKGDGTFAQIQECKPKYRKEPVYDDRCRYTIDTWSVTRTEEAKGQGLEPRWPTVQIRGTQEREGRRNAVYRVRLLDEDGQQHTCDLSEARWRGLKPNQKIEATFGGLTGAIDCSSLSP